MASDSLFSQRELAPGVTLLHHRSSKWKKENLRLIFADAPEATAGAPEELSRRNAARALGASLYRHGHRGLRGMDRVIRHYQDLYGGGLSVQSTRSSRHQLVLMRGQVIAGRYLPDRPQTFEALIEYVGRLLREPWFGMRSFDKDLFDLEKANLLRAIDGIYDNKSHYADQKLQAQLFDGHPLGVPSYGERADVEAVELDEARDAVSEFLARTPVFIYAVGPQSEASVVRSLKKHLPLEGREPFAVGRFRGPEIRKRAKTEREAQPISQARLAMGFRLEGYRRDRDLYAAQIGDGILGGTSSSKLFRDVREKKSLAYSIHSTFDGGTGTLYVSAGTDDKNLDRTQKLVRRHLKDMGMGRFDASDRAVALASIESTLAGTEDSAPSMIGYHLGTMLTGRKDRHPDASLRRYRRANEEKIAEVFSRFHLDSVFRLEVAQ